MGIRTKAPHEAIVYQASQSAKRDPFIPLSEADLERGLSTRQKQAVRDLLNMTPLINQLVQLSDDSATQKDESHG